MPVADSKLPWLILCLLPEMTRVRFYTLFDHFQSPRLALGAGAAEIASLRGFDAAAGTQGVGSAADRSSPAGAGPYGGARRATRDYRLTYT